MTSERRNLYRLLHVQPEAPLEVIKASFRAQMSTMRGHPDLGGDPEQAARLIAAYDVLSDPERRRAYDLSLSKPGARSSSAAPGAGPRPATPVIHNPTRWLIDRRCPFCSLAFGRKPAREDRCGRCASPIHPAPEAEHAPGEKQGRRRAERIARDMQAVLRLPGQPGEYAARLRDLSFTGLSLAAAPRLARQTTIRVTTASFDAVALVIACRASGAAHTVHAHLLTLQVLSAGRGAFVAARA